MLDIKMNPFTKLSKDFGLLTCGNKDKFNSMTIGWGNFGTIYAEDSLIIYVRPSRYTMEFLKENDYFTVSFFSEDYKKMFGIMGSKSGRDTDKVKLTGLTPKFLENTVTYEEALETFVCKKIYLTKIEVDKLPEEYKSNYAEDEKGHFMIISVIKDYLKK